MKNVTLKVEGMNCGKCVNRIEGTMKELGVKGTVDLGNRTVTIEYDETKVGLETIKEAIEEQGYAVV